ncbi:MAG: outer membrane lipoprotein carrier protein LolA [Deltaproteobacteria bacterium]|nr:outer membrane lipoprotein carrier protein LolA [Deltaproteobacteria bacterium]
MSGLILLACLTIFSVYPSSSEARPVEGTLLNEKETTIALKTIKDLQSGLSSMQARIYQKKTTPLLKEAVESEGTLTLKKPNLLNMSLTRPKPLRMVGDGEVLWVYKPDSKEAEKHVLASDMAANETIKFLSSAIAMSTDELSDRFDISAYSGASTLTLAMTPKSAIVARYLSKINVSYRDGEAVPFKFEVISKNGGRAITEFNEVVLNPRLSNDAFRFKLPPDARITNLENEPQ